MLKQSIAKLAHCIMIEVFQKSKPKMLKKTVKLFSFYVLKYNAMIKKSRF